MPCGVQTFRIGNLTAIDFARTCASACVVEPLRQERPGQPHSRKLGGVAEVAFS